MDNITHAFTGALAARMIDRQPSVPEKEKSKRILFWLIVIAANIPDIDILFGLSGDRIFSFQLHRGITHSLIFAPVFALLFALAFRLFTKTPLLILWAASWMGIMLHIMIDLITPFGTQILAPFSIGRFSLDWMSIVDPYFTGGIGILLYCSRRLARMRRVFLRLCAGFIGVYLGLAVLCHAAAYRSFGRMMEKSGVAAKSFSALPQPLGMFRWMGAARYDSGVVTSCFSVLDKTPPEISMQRDDHDSYTQAALATREGAWYVQFARFPLVTSKMENGRHIVEIHDLQFSFVQFLAERYGGGRRAAPFTMRFTFTARGGISGITFDS